MNFLSSCLLNVAIIGASSGKGQDFIEALNGRQDVKIVACVVNENIPKNIEKLQESGVTIIKNGDVSRLISEIPFDVAIVSLPHYLHDGVTRQLLEAKKIIIKEKPLALNETIARSYAQKGSVPIFTTVQRSTHPIFLEAKKDLSLIGEPVSFKYTYTFSLPSKTSGWRGESAKSGGGVVLDMGYHIIDVVLDFFGQPSSVEATFGYKFPEMEKQKLEDSSTLTFSYPSSLRGELILDRHAEKKEERFEIEGALGTMIITPTTYDILVGSETVKHVENSLTKIQVIQKMFDVCLTQQPDSVMLEKQFDRNIQTLSIIDKAYKQKEKKYRTDMNTLPPLSEAAKSLKPGYYEHFKGLKYRLVSVGRHSETLEEYVVYQALYGDQLTWVRPLPLFVETVTKDGKSFPRFKYLGTSLDK